MGVLFISPVSVRRYGFSFCCFKVFLHQATSLPVSLSPPLPPLSLTFSLSSSVFLTCRCTAIEAALTHDNAMDTLAGVDLVVDASDNPRTRYLVNDACVLAGKPLASFFFFR